VATCRCPACLAWNLAAAEHCQACGQRLGADDRAGQPAAGFRCPRCARGLAARRYAELEVEECDGCGGLFLTPAMLDRVVRSRDQSTGLRLALPQPKPFIEQEVRYVRCPACDKLMNRNAFGRISGVVVDVCRSHGVWFDAGELTQVIQFVERGGLERAREREAEERSEQVRSLHAAQVAGMASAEWQPEPGALDDRGCAELAREFVDAIAQLWRR
jgi:Zn-finger nucleic acid-binding protein